MTADLGIRSARALSVAERAELFTAAYEGYVVPMHIDEAALAWMQDKFDFDVDASRIAYLDGEPVGLANLAIRGRDAWVGGIGVVPSAPPRRALCVHCTRRRCSAASSGSGSR